MGEGEWTEKNPILLAGEIGIEKDTGKFKFGDGITNWNDLEYAGMDIQQIKNLIDENEDNVYEVVADEEDDLGALSTVAQNPKKGDCIMEERKSIGSLTSGGCQVLKKRYIIIDNIEQQVGEIIACYYPNTEQGRKDIQEREPENISSAALAMWGDTIYSSSINT